MLVTKIKFMAMLLLFLSFLGGGIGALTYGMTEGKPLVAGPADKTIKLRNAPAGKEIPTDASKDADKLARARVDAAHKAYDVAANSVKQNIPGAKFESVCTWSVRWLNAQRDMSSKKEDHVSALNAHLRRMQEQAKAAKTLWEAGRLGPLESAAAEYYLTEAEFWVAQARAGAKNANR